MLMDNPTYIWLTGKVEEFKFAGKGIPVSRVHMARLKGYKAPALPDLAKADEATLIKHLTGPSYSIRLQAQQYLLKKGVSANSAKSLEAISADSSKHLPCSYRCAIHFETSTR